MRSLLFVPGDNPRKFEKARLTPADALILDLEGSVAEDRKDEARAITRAMLEGDRGAQRAPSGGLAVLPKATFADAWIPRRRVGRV